MAMMATPFGHFEHTKDTGEHISRQDRQLTFVMFVPKTDTCASMSDRPASNRGRVLRRESLKMQGDIPFATPKRDSVTQFRRQNMKVARRNSAPACANVFTRCSPSLSRTAELELLSCAVAGLSSAQRDRGSTLSIDTMFHASYKPNVNMCLSGENSDGTFTPENPSPQLSLSTLSANACSQEQNLIMTFLDSLLAENVIEMTHKGQEAANAAFGNSAMTSLVASTDQQAPTPTMLPTLSVCSSAQLGSEFGVPSVVGGEVFGRDEFSGADFDSLRLTPLNTYSEPVSADSFFDVATPPADISFATQPADIFESIGTMRMGCLPNGIGAPGTLHTQTHSILSSSAHHTNPPQTTLLGGGPGVFSYVSGLMNPPKPLFSSGISTGSPTIYDNASSHTYRLSSTQSSPATMETASPPPSTDTSPAPLRQTALVPILPNVVSSPPNGNSHSKSSVVAGLNRAGEKMDEPRVFFCTQGPDCKKSYCSWKSLKFHMSGKHAVKMTRQAYSLQRLEVSANQNRRQSVFHK